MTSDTKRKTLVYLAGVAILTVIIAVALQHLELKPGIPFPALADRGGQSLPKQDLRGLPISISDFWKAIISLSLLIAILYTSYQLLRHANWSWQDVLKSLAYTSMLFLVVAFILWILLSGGSSTFTPAEAPPPPPMEKQTGPPLSPLPVILIWVVGSVLAASLVGMGLWIIFRPADRANPDQLSLQAEWALQALKKGLDLKNVIVRCYWEMGQVLQEEQGIEMKTAMTVREFERLLAARGVPPLPVHQLTQLFEMARYSHQPTSSEDERRAIDALTAIMQYSRTTKS